MEVINKVFDDYTKEFMSDIDNKNGYIEKYNHAYFVKNQALELDKRGTKYNSEFQKLLAIESLYHNIGEFHHSADNYNHGIIGANVMKKTLLRRIFPNTNQYDEEIMKVIQLQDKDNQHLFNSVKNEHIEVFRNYSLDEVFGSNKTLEARNSLTGFNVAMIQDASKLDIFMKIANGIYIPNSSNQEISEIVWEWFLSDNLPTIKELKEKGYWNINVEHLVRLSLINQMSLVPQLQKIKDEFLIQKNYVMCGNQIVKPAYDYAIEKVDELLEQNQNKILVKR